jgi:hypothetical protein
MGFLSAASTCNVWLVMTVGSTRFVFHADAPFDAWNIDELTHAEITGVGGVKSVRGTGFSMDASEPMSFMTKAFIASLPFVPSNFAQYGKHGQPVCYVAGLLAHRPKMLLIVAGPASRPQLGRSGPGAEFDGVY